MMRKAAREHAGWLRSGINTAEDWDFIIRLAKVGPLAFIDKALLEYRYHVGQMSSPNSATVAAFSCIAVVESTMSEQAALADPQLYRELAHTLAGYHSEAAYALAEFAPVKALRHLLKSWSSPQDWRYTARLLARIAAPRAGFRLLRALRSNNDSHLHRR